jgi:hypothetical protein
MVNIAHLRGEVLLKVLAVDQDCSVSPTVFTVESGHQKWRPRLWPLTPKIKHGIR